VKLCADAGEIRKIDAKVTGKNLISPPRKLSKFESIKGCNVSDHALRVCSKIATEELYPMRGMQTSFGGESSRAAVYIFLAVLALFGL
jgi:hypothetical protein